MSASIVSLVPSWSIDQHGAVAAEAGHQHPTLVTSIQSPACHAGTGMLVTSIQCTRMRSSLPMPVPESCSVSILICHTCQVNGLSYWTLTNACSESEKHNYFVYIKRKTTMQLLSSTSERNGSKKTKCSLYIFVYLVQYLQFVSGTLKWPQNLAVLKLVFNNLGVLWRHHWFCVLYWPFTANFTPPHTQWWKKL